MSSSSRSTRNNHTRDGVNNHLNVIELDVRDVAVPRLPGGGIQQTREVSTRKRTRLEDQEFRSQKEQQLLRTHTGKPEINVGQYIRTNHEFLDSWRF